MSMEPAESANMGSVAFPQLGELYDHPEYNEALDAYHTVGLALSEVDDGPEEDYNQELKDYDRELEEYDSLEPPTAPAVAPRSSMEAGLHAETGTIRVAPPATQAMATFVAAEMGGSSIPTPLQIRRPLRSWTYNSSTDSTQPSLAITITPQITQFYSSNDRRAAKTPELGLLFEKRTSGNWPTMSLEGQASSAPTAIRKTVNDVSCAVLWSFTRSLVDAYQGRMWACRGNSDRALSDKETLMTEAGDGARSSVESGVNRSGLGSDAARNFCLSIILNKPPHELCDLSAHLTPTAARQDLKGSDYKSAPYAANGSVYCIKAVPRWQKQAQMSVGGEAREGMTDEGGQDAGVPVPVWREFAIDLKNVRHDQDGDA